MGKRKVIATDQMPVDLIRWKDPKGWQRERIDLEIIENVTVGFVFYEDDEQVVLLHEVEAREDYHKSATDGTQILKTLIQSRKRLSEPVRVSSESEVP